MTGSAEAVTGMAGSIYPVYDSLLKCMSALIGMKNARSASPALVG